jgi:hypothetical protein
MVYYFAAGLPMFCRCFVLVLYHFCPGRTGNKKPLTLAMSGPYSSMIDSVEPGMVTNFSSLLVIAREVVRWLRLPSDQCSLEEWA